MSNETQLDFGDVASLAPIKKLKFADGIVDGEAFDDVFLLDEINEKFKKGGGKYWTMTLRDRTGTVKAKAWDDTAFCGDPIPTRGVFVKVRATAGTYRDEIDLTLRKIRPLAHPETIAVEDFVPVGPKDRFTVVRLMEDTLNKTVFHPGFLAVCKAVFADPALHSALRDAPAAKSVHHAFVGGLADHVYSMMGVTLSLFDHYGSEKLDLDLLLTACLFHDIGKTRELTWATSLGYSQEGQLVGHVAIGLEILDCFRPVYWKAVEDSFGRPALGGEKVDSLDLGDHARARTKWVEDAAVKWNHLRHLIASHHGKLEWSAIKEPMSREAIVFHLIDMIDSRMGALDLVDQAEKRDEEGFTGWVKVLGGPNWKP